MKQKPLLTALFCCIFLSNIAKANESEPNDDRASANTLALNGNNSGKINPTGDQDWWKVTTTGDGKLDITLTPLSGRYIWVYLYDNNGAIQLNAQNKNVQFTLSQDGLAAGTYYIKVVCYYASDTGSYTISNTLTQPVQLNDAEPDSTRNQALTLGLNSNTTGHVGYYYNNHRDTADWYKVTTNADGRLRLSLTPANGNYVWIYLYDNNGTTLINSADAANTFNVTSDGLAAGTYYIKIQCYYQNSDFAPYTLSDSLFIPAQVNDKEPNDAKANADTLLLNNSITGHAGYYYNNHRDTADWYKVTTNGDGRLRLSLTPANGNYVWIYLYDNNGTTVLNSGNASIPFSVSTDGLAAGTYYVKINCYYSTDFAPYILSDSLFKPAQANDAEPNGTKATAKTLGVNKSTTGHVGYYYNLQRDTADWYKITTPTDGLLRLSLTPATGTYLWIYLYDNNGTTLLNSSNNYVPFSVSTDGLAAGTYYVKINCYFANTDFAPYILSDSLFTYAYAGDAESNNRPYLAKTMPANGVVTGHAGFYYNLKRDSTDWWKINYTGSGAMSVTARFEPNKNGQYRYVWMDIYKDTLAAPLYSQNNNTPTLVANLNALTQGYYYVRVHTYYNSDFVAYSLTDTFTQVNIASVKATTYDTVASCSSINTITFNCSNSSAPYTVKLYRYGVLYATKIAKAKAVTFDTLPPGSYYAKAFGDGATGSASGKSKNVNVVPIPTNLSTTGLTTTQATLNWTPVSCAQFDSIYYRVHGTTTWTRTNTSGNPPSFLLGGLAASTTYDWQIAAVDSANGIIARGAVSAIVTFTTPASSPVSGTGEADNVAAAGIAGSRLLVMPNPATNNFKIQFSGVNSKVQAVLVDVNGKATWSSGLVDASALNGKQVNIANFSAGTYLLQISDDKSRVISKTKLVIEK